MPIEAFALLLHTQDLSKFNHASPPLSVAKMEQQVMSFAPIDNWWHETLTNGTLVESPTLAPKDLPMYQRTIVSTQSLFESYKRYTQGRFTGNVNSFGAQFGKLCDSESVVKRVNGKQLRVRDLPPLVELREFFAKSRGIGMAQLFPDHDIEIAACLEETIESAEQAPPPYTVVVPTKSYTNDASLHQRGMELLTLLLGA